MPIHDWTRVTAGTWHAFHLSWIAEIQLALNGGILPARYYAQAEQIAGPLGPDVLTLQEPDAPVNGDAGLPSSSNSGGVAVAIAPPRMRMTAEAEMDDYVLKRRTLVICHAIGDRIIALLEIVSPGNKSSRHGLRSFVEKAVEALYRGYHLLLIDLFPAGRRDPNGIHGAIWAELCEASFQLPADEPLTLAAYSAGPRKRYLCGADRGRTRVDRYAAVFAGRDLRQRATGIDVPSRLSGRAAALAARIGSAIAQRTPRAGSVSDETIRRESNKMAEEEHDDNVDSRTTPTATRKHRAAAAP